MVAWQRTHSPRVWNPRRPCGTLAAKGSTWHSRQVNRSSRRVKRLRVTLPWGVWQIVQPSIFTAACSKTQGPRFSVWQATQASQLVFRSSGRYAKMVTSSQRRFSNSPPSGTHATRDKHRTAVIL